MGDADSCKDGDAGAAKSDVFNCSRYKIAEIHFGDLHKRGAVCRIAFENNKASIFYKPRNLGITETFHLFLDELNALGLSPRLQKYLVLPRDEYGWEESVEHTPCKNKNEVLSYFERSGMYLCLMYLLGGFDGHEQNIIALGEHPMLIDLESLFHVSPVAHSVLQTGLLPGIGKGAQISGLAIEGENSIPSISLPKWHNLNTDDITLTYENAVKQPEKNRVLLGDQHIAAKDNVDVITSGFKKMYAFIQHHTSFLLRKNGSLHAFGGYPVHFINRSSVFYLRFLQRLRDPEVILHPEIAEKEFANVVNALSEKGSKMHESIVKMEKGSLFQGNFPYFYCNPKEPHLFSNGNKICSNALASSGMEQVLTRIKNMYHQDLELQATLIQEAFSGC